MTNVPIESVVAAPDAGRDQGEFARQGVNGHDVGCRRNSGPVGRSRRASFEATKGRCRDRDARAAMLLPVVQAGRLSARSSLSKSEPCNIIIVSAALEAEVI